MMNNSVTCPFPFFQVQFRIQPTKIRRSIWGHAAPLKVSSKDFSTVQLLPNGGRNQHSFMVLPMVSMVVPMGMVLLSILSVEGEGVGEGTAWGSSRTPDWGSSRTNRNGPYERERSISLQSISCIIWSQWTTLSLSSLTCQDSHENKEKSECHLQRSKTKLFVRISWCLVCSSCAGWYKNGQSINTCCFMGFFGFIGLELSIACVM